MKTALTKQSFSSALAALAVLSGCGASTPEPAAPQEVTANKILYSRSKVARRTPADFRVYRRAKQRSATGWLECVFIRPDRPPSHVERP